MLAHSLQKLCPLLPGDPGLHRLIQLRLQHLLSLSGHLLLRLGRLQLRYQCQNLLRRPRRRRLRRPCLVGSSIDLILRPGILALSAALTEVFGDFRDQGGLNWDKRTLVEDTTP